jgi:hypothetical protein
LTILIWLLALLAVFQGLVVPGLEAAGVAPFLVLQAALLCYALGYWCLRGLRVPPQWRAFLFWFTGFVLVCVVSGLLLPILFSGIQIYAPKGGIDEQYTTKALLALSPANFAQILFIVLYWVYIALLTTIDRIDFRAALPRAYLASGIVVIFFAYYQLLSILTGVYFPSAILLNNTSYGLADASTGFSFLPRINATFTEPSMFAMYMAAFVAWSYIKFLHAPGARARWAALLLAAVLALLLSASTAGYLALALFFVAHTAVTLYRRDDAPRRRRTLTIVALLSAALVAAYLLVPGVDVILNAVLFEKGASDSSTHRLAADSFALDTLAQTWFLGAGLGSTRPSSFLAMLLSNVGLIGTLFFALAAATLVGMGRRARPGRSAAELGELQAAGWALLTMLAAKLIAGPELNFPPMWILAGYYILFIRNDPVAA